MDETTRHEISRFLGWLERQSLAICDPRIEGGRWEFNYDEVSREEVMRRYAESGEA